MRNSQITQQQWVAKVVLALCLISVVLIIALSSGNKHGYQDVIESGTLTIITRNSPSTYYQDRDEESGFEYELAHLFAKYLGVELKVVVADDLDELITEVETGNVAFAAAGITKTQQRSERIQFADSYMDVTQKLVYRTDKRKPRNLQVLLNGTLVVTAHSSHAQNLKKIQKESMPSLSWKERDDADVAELVRMVEDGEIDYTIVNSNEFEALSAFHPNIAAAFDMSEQQQLAWAFPKYSDQTLIAEAKNFFQLMRESGLLSQLEERYYGHLDQIDSVGTLTFLSQADQRLHEYQELFEQAATDNDLDWRLIAAIGYQESHWKAKARSRTGVRGLMMLTRKTAKEMGVTNRLDPVQSITGGSAYFAKLKKRYRHIQEPDRTWIALASYNVGAGHVRDAQKITEAQGGDPTRWMDLKERLPLLTQRKWYKNTRYGYARGNEPVTYVQNIRRFYDLLVWRDQPEPNQDVTAEGSLFTANNYTTIEPLTTIN
ncbi:MAG: membrane-bound lytic murein transglycosylase F [Psychrobacter glaciei]|jgi:membrane-bound lytic murein transglycosylase F